MKQVIKKSNSIINYNQEIENEIDEFMSNYFQLDKEDYHYKPDQLKEWFKKTKYPGILFQLGKLCDQGLIKEDHSDYYLIKAGEMNYLPALIYLGEKYLRYSNIEMHRTYEYLEKAANQFNDAKAHYLLGSYYLRYALCEPSKILFEAGITHLKQASQLDNREAINLINFLKDMKENL